jgi:hypothetical protein
VTAPATSPDTIATSSTTAATTTTSQAVPRPSGSEDTFTLEGTGNYLEELGFKLTNQEVVVTSINGGLISLLDADARQVFLLTAYDGLYEGGETRLRDPSEVFFVHVEPDTDDPWSIVFRQLTDSDKAELPVVSGEGDNMVWLVGAPSGVSKITLDALCRSKESIYVEIFDADRNTAGSGFYFSDDELPAEMLVTEGAEMLAVEAEGCSWTLTWP